MELELDTKEENILLLKNMLLEPYSEGDPFLEDYDESVEDVLNFEDKTAEKLGKKLESFDEVAMVKIEGEYDMHRIFASDSDHIQAVLLPLYPMYMNAIFCKRERGLEKSNKNMSFLTKLPIFDENGHERISIGKVEVSWLKALPPDESIEIEASENGFRMTSSDYSLSRNFKECTAKVITAPKYLLTFVPVAYPSEIRIAKKENMPLLVEWDLGSYYPFHTVVAPRIETD